MLKSAIILLVCTVLSKVLGFVRELAVAYKFGTGAISDAFVTTNRVPTILFSALSVAISINFIPVIVGIENSEEEQDKFTSNLINVFLVLMGIGIILMICFPDIVLFIFAGGLNQEAHELAVQMLRITAFSVIPIVLSQIFQAYLQTKNRFISTGITGVICNITVILFTLLATDGTYQLLSIGTLVSNLIMMFILICELKHIRFHYQPVLNVHDENLQKLVLLTLPLLLETLTSELNSVVDSNMASRLDSGTITSLSYANSLVKMAYVMIATTIITIIFPKFSRYFSEKNFDILRKEFIYYGDVLAVLLLPISIVMIALSRPLIDFLFLRGAFSTGAAIITQESMVWYAVGIFALGMKSYVIRMFYSFKDTKTPTKYAILALVINIVLNFIFIIPFKHIGLALSTSIASTIAYVILLKRLDGILGSCLFKQTMKNHIRLLVSAAIPGGIIYYIYIKCFQNWNDLLVLFLLGGIYIVIYFGILICSKHYLVSDLWEFCKQRGRTVDKK